MTLYRTGKIINTHGIRGEVKVEAITDLPELRFKIGEMLYVIDSKTEQSEPLKIVKSRLHKGKYLLQFEDLENINLVEKYKGEELFSDIEHDEALPDDQYYYDQIIGLTVEDEQGNALGEISDVLTLPSNDVWTIELLNSKEALIPVIDEVVKSVDLDAGKVVIEVLEGLID